MVIWSIRDSILIGQNHIKIVFWVAPINDLPRSAIYCVQKTLYGSPFDAKEVSLNSVSGFYKCTNKKIRGKNCRNGCLSSCTGILFGRYGRSKLDLSSMINLLTYQIFFPTYLRVTEEQILPMKFCWRSAVTGQRPWCKKCWRPISAFNCPKMLWQQQMQEVDSTYMQRMYKFRTWPSFIVEFPNRLLWSFRMDLVLSNWWRGTKYYRTFSSCCCGVKGKKSVSMRCTESYTKAELNINAT